MHKRTSRFHAELPTVVAGAGGAGSVAGVAAEESKQAWSNQLCEKRDVWVSELLRRERKEP